MFGHSPLIESSDLRRARGTRVLVWSDTEATRELNTALERHGVIVKRRAGTSVPDWSRIAGDCDLVVIHARAGAFTVMEGLSTFSKELCIPFCVVFSDDDPDDRVRALTLGAADVMSTRWSRVELIARIVKLLANHMRYTHARCVHATLRKRMSDKNRLLDCTRLEMVHRLGRAAEYRDNETGQHVVRVGLFCEIIGKHLAMPRRQVQLLRHASPLHDIGKIGVADAILLKAGPLSPEEWQIMKQHTVIGAEILSGTDDELLEMARVIALTHHERWDGEGYPAGLAGDDIPLCGRIASVCDVYDALTSDRPYKKRWAHKDALLYIKRGSGSQFDPDVVNAFVASLTRIRSVQRRHSDSGAPNNVYCGGSFGPPVDGTCSSDWVLM